MIPVTEQESEWELFDEVAVVVSGDEKTMTVDTGNAVFINHVYVSNHVESLRLRVLLSRSRGNKPLVALIECKKLWIFVED